MKPLIISNSSRFSVQIIVNLEKTTKIHKIDETKHLESKDYSRRLALENQAIDILRQHHSSDSTTI